MCLCSKLDPWIYLSSKDVVWATAKWRACSCVHGFTQHTCIQLGVHQDDVWFEFHCTLVTFTHADCSWLHLSKGFTRNHKVMYLSSLCYVIPVASIHMLFKNVFQKTSKNYIIHLILVFTNTTVSEWERGRGGRVTTNYFFMEGEGGGSQQTLFPEMSKWLNNVLEEEWTLSK